MNIVLGVCGSIAAYRAADLSRELMRAGHDVRVCLTAAAKNFVFPALFETLTGNVCLSDTFEEPVAGRMAHIDWARWADLVVIAPATANTLAKLAHGGGDDMLTTLCLATRAPWVLAPAMNPQMFANDANRQNLEILRRRAALVVEPSEGDVACGEHGQGKLASIEEIVAAVSIIGRRSQVLSGKVVLITSGPTREPIDEVRFIGNRSSGKMGAALAKAALLMGAKEVHVVSGPVHVAYPLDANVVQVVTAEQMMAECRAFAARADLIVGAAAVADYRPKSPAVGKLRRSDDNLSLELIPNPDIIASIAAQTNGKVIGFAAEPDESLDYARAKLDKKGLHAIAVNNVSRAEIGFDTEVNELTLVTRERTANSGMQSKLSCAIWLFEQLS